MVMKRICRTCGLEKNIEEFHKSKSFSDGRNNKCAKCVNDYNSLYGKKKRQEQKKDTSLRGMILVHPTKEDYKKMYLFLKTIGYDPTKDIHKQFCEKYNVPYKERADKNHNFYTWEDCIKNGG